YDTSNSGLPDNRICSVTIDAQGNKWIGTVNGLAIYREGGVVSVEERMDEKTGNPHDFALLQNYPNPFNPTTTIQFQLPESGYMTLKVYDMLGREVARLIDGYRNAGSYSAIFDAGRFSSGTYLYEVRCNNIHQVKKMLLVK
ncbi:MAG: T9SS type A sorting domain-containing protein, partial [Bacteroidota bacterium]